MKFDDIYKKVIDSCKAFEERQVPIHLDFKIEDLRDALIESNDTIEKLVGAKKSAEKILQNLLDYGLIKEWYFNGKFNVVFNADDPHLEIAELKHKLEDAEADDVRPKIDVRKFDLDDKTTWPDPERDGEYVLVYFGKDAIVKCYEYPYEIKRTEFVADYNGVVAWVPMKDFFNAIEKELENGDGR